MLTSQLGERVACPLPWGQLQAGVPHRHRGSHWDATSALRSHPGAACAHPGTALPLEGPSVLMKP